MKSTSLIWEDKLNVNFIQEVFKYSLKTHIMTGLLANRDIMFVPNA